MRKITPTHQLPQSLSTPHPAAEIWHSFRRHFILPDHTTEFAQPFDFDEAGSNGFRVEDVNCIADFGLNVIGGGYYVVGSVVVVVIITSIVVMTIVLLSLALRFTRGIIFHRIRPGKLRQPQNDLLPVIFKVVQCLIIQLRLDLLDLSVAVHHLIPTLEIGIVARPQPNRRVVSVAAAVADRSGDITFLDRLMRC